MSEDVVIVGMGMITAVGLTAAENAASIRAGTARFTESPFWDKTGTPFVLAEVPEAALPPLVDELDREAGLTSRERRMLRLATKPLLECLSVFPQQSTSIGLCLALPEIETTRPLDRSAFLKRLAVQTGGRIEARASDARQTGRAGGLLAVGQAVLSLKNGLADFIIAGGVDTHRDAYTLALLDKEERVKSAVNLDGFIPGEGAAFLLLATRHAALANRMSVLGTVSPLGMGFETGHLYSSETYRGDGLATTFRQLLDQRIVDAPIAEVYSSMTGESHWAKEWGVAFMRNRAAFHESYGMHHSADCTGDIGAASGPLMLALAALGLRDHYRRAPVLAYGSSDRGARAAVILAS